MNHLIYIWQVALDMPGITAFVLGAIVLWFFVIKSFIVRPKKQRETREDPHTAFSTFFECDPNPQDPETKKQVMRKLRGLYKEWQDSQKKYKNAVEKRVRPAATEEEINLLEIHASSSKDLFDGALGIAIGYGYQIEMLRIISKN